MFTVPKALAKIRITSEKEDIPLSGISPVSFGTEGWKEAQELQEEGAQCGAAFRRNPITGRRSMAV